MSDKHIAMEYTLKTGSACTFIALPDPVGWIYFAPTKMNIAAYHKPRWLTRFMLRVFFELRWKEKE